MLASIEISQFKRDVWFCGAKLSHNRCGLRPSAQRKFHGDRKCGSPEDVDGAI